MKLEEEFFDFLVSNFRGKTTGRPYSIKAARDAISRLRRAERVLGKNIQFGAHPEKDLLRLKNAVSMRSEELGRTLGNPYGHNATLNALSRYYDFFTSEHFSQ